ncbi:MAG TPA: acetolactate synthase small subunit [Phycisphaerae bacterium]|nr:acetolactate synthase small subunit [Phycisphaerae bacterium]
MRHVISAIVENKPGVLAHIAGLFAGRGFNIDSLAVGETEDPTRSRMTVVARGDDAVLEQVRKQLGKIIDVIKVTDFSGTDCVERDLMLIKVAARPEKRGEIFEIVEVFRAKVVDIGPKHLTLELSGPEKKIEAFVDLMKPYGVRELVRTGRIALARGV